MRSFILCSLLVLLCSVPGALAASGTITLEFDLSDHPKNEEVKLWVPYPISGDHQQIDDIKIQGNYTEAAVYTDREFQTPMLYIRWGAGLASRELSFSFRAERQEVIRRDFPAMEGPWNTTDFAPYLVPTSFGPVDGEVRELADRITRGEETVLGKARAIYDWTVENMYRDPETRGCGTGDVCALLVKPGGKCADISSVYVALARAAGVPAREIFGLRLGRTEREDVTTWQHCWAEFYLPGYGWVPVDPADVRKAMLAENLKLNDPKTKEYRAYFWGGIDSYRVALSEGRDLTLNPAQQAGTLNYFMYPYAEVGGRPLDWLDSERFRYRITFHQ